MDLRLVFDDVHGSCLVNFISPLSFPSCNDRSAPLA